MRGSDFAELTAFVLVAEHRSYGSETTWHRRPESPRPAVEEQKGVRLLNRTTRSVAPTKAGERLLVRLRPVLTALESASRIEDDESDVPAGPLRLTIPPPAVGSIVTPILTRFMAAYPRIELEISVDGTSVDIVREGFDAGIRYGPHLERDMIALRIGESVRPVTVASPAYVTRRGQPKSPEELSVQQCIRIRLPGGNILPWRYHRRGKVFSVQPGGSLVVNDRELELAAVLDGGGIAYFFPPVSRLHLTRAALQHCCRTGRFRSPISISITPPGGNCPFRCKRSSAFYARKVLSSKAFGPLIGPLPEKARSELPDGSHRRICLPPGPLVMSLRKWTPAQRINLFGNVCCVQDDAVPATRLRPFSIRQHLRGAARALWGARMS